MSDHFKKIHDDAITAIHQVMFGDTTKIIPGASGVSWPTVKPAEESSEADDASISSIIKKEYRTTGEIGRGGMGKVDGAIELLLDREVAVKRVNVPPGTRISKEAVAEFLREPLVMAKIGHPNIPHVYEVNVDEHKQPYFAMTKINGDALNEVIARLDMFDPDYHKRFSLSRRLEIFKGICYAVACAHSNGIIHRDLKPSNVMVGEFGEVYVIDWGLAKIIGEDVGFGSTIMSELEVEKLQFTLDGMVKGTPAYMPPEQAEGMIDKLDERSDVYSLGATLYAFLLFQAPVTGRTTSEVMQNTMAGRIVHPRDQPIKIDHRLSDILVKSLAKKRRDRHQTVNELIDDVAAYIAQMQKSVGDKLRKALDALNRGYKYETVLGIIDTAKEEDPDSEDVYLTEGQVHEKFGKADDAVTSYLTANDKRMKKTRTPNTRAIFYAAEVARNLKWDQEKAMELYQKCMLARDPEALEEHSLLSEAYLLFFNEEIPRSITILNRILDLDPNIAEAYSFLGTIYSGIRDRTIIKGFNSLKKRLKQFFDLEKAESYFTKAIENSSGMKKGDYHALRALTRLSKGDIEAGERDVEDSVMLNNSLGNQMVRLNLLEKKGEFDKLILLANYMIEFIHHERPVLIYNRGFAYRRKGMLDEAFADFEKAVELDSKKPDQLFSPADALYSMALVFGSKGDLDKAIEKYERAVKEDPEHFKAFNNMAYHYRELGKPEKAVEKASEAVRVNEDYGLGYLTRGLAYLDIWARDNEDSAFENAFNDLRKSLEFKLSPGDRKDAMQHLGKAYKIIAEQFVLEKEHDLAMTAYEEALKLELDPKVRIEFENAKKKLADST